MDSPIPTGQDNEEPLKNEGSKASDQNAEEPRRTFLKAGLKGVLLLPYVVPLIESIRLSDASAKSKKSKKSTKPAPSQIGNLPPPPPSDDDDDDDDNTNS